MDMNWNFISSSVWLNMVAGAFSCSCLVTRSRSRGAADVASLVSSSMPFSRVLTHISAQVIPSGFSAV